MMSGYLLLYRSRHFVGNKCMVGMATCSGSSRGTVVVGQTKPPMIGNQVRSRTGYVQNEQVSRQLLASSAYGAGEVVGTWLWSRLRKLVACPVNPFRSRLDQISHMSNICTLSQ